MHSTRARLRGLLYARVPVRLPHAGKVFAALSVLGVAGLSYVLGAAVMFFQLPSYDFLHQAFTGGRAWHERGQPALNPFVPPDIDDRDGVTADDPALTCEVVPGPDNGAALQVRVERGRLRGDSLSSAVRVRLSSPVRDTVVIPVLCTADP